MPQMMLISVVLPAPLGPRSAKISPLLDVERDAFQRLETGRIGFRDVGNGNDGLHGRQSERLVLVTRGSRRDLLYGCAPFGECSLCSRAKPRSALSGERLSVSGHDIEDLDTFVAVRPGIRDHASGDGCAADPSRRNATSLPHSPNRKWSRIRFPQDRPPAAFQLQELFPRAGEYLPHRDIWHIHPPCRPWSGRAKFERWWHWCETWSKPFRVERGPGGASLSCYNGRARRAVPLSGSGSA